MCGGSDDDGGSATRAGTCGATAIRMQNLGRVQSDQKEQERRTKGQLVW